LGSNPGRARDFLLQSDKIGPGTHGNSSMGIRETSNAVKEAGE